MEKNTGRRDFFKSLGAAAAGGLAYSVANKLSTPSKKEELAKDIKKEIEEFKKGFISHKKFTELAQEKVIGGNGLSRHAYLHEYFKRHEAKNIPDDIRNIMAELIPGLAAQESKYENGLTSKAGACGILQIMPGTFRDLRGNDKEEWEKVKSSLVEQTNFCFEYLDERVCHYINETEGAVPLEGICRQYELNKKEADIFSALVLINGYNAGQGNMRGILKIFSQNYDSKKDLPESYNGTGISLFYTLINAAFKNRFKKGYGKEARDYVLKILAGSEVMNERLGTSYGIDINAKGVSTGGRKSGIRKTAEAAGVGAAVGITTNAALSIANKKRDKPLINLPIGRRHFLKLGTYAAAGVAGSKILDIFSSDKKPEKKKDKDNAFSDGTIFNQSYVEDELEKFYKENSRIFPDAGFAGNINNVNEETLESLPSKNYKSSGFKNWFQENMDKGNITRYNSAKEIERAKDNGKLKAVTEVNSLWRCFHVKGGHKYAGNNNPIYLALHPKGLEMLEDLAEIFQKKLREAGLDNSKWKIRPKIESLMRDEKLANGSDLSPREFGLGIDFSKKRAFDLIHVPDNKFMVIDEEDNAALYKSVEILFMEALKDLDKSRKVIITSESHPPHFHIATKI